MSCITARQLLTATFPTNRKVGERQIAKNDIIISAYVTRQVDLCQPLKRECVNLPVYVFVSVCVCVRVCVPLYVSERVCVCLTCSIWRIQALGGCHTIGRRKPAEG